ncbi:MAG: prephenate dehydrogenase [Oscillospiraceae bacterium]|nr:prephenate dehydrogenase [Oscillospiraceae bacterium]
MKIAIVGLGLIGASFAKALRQTGCHTVWGIDRDSGVSEKAVNQEIVDRMIGPDELAEADLTLVALYPEAAITFLLNHKERLKKGSIAADVCGVKTKVVSALDEPLAAAGIRYVGTHPMAGREFSGIDYSKADLYRGANFIVTPTARTDPDAVEVLSGLARRIGFGKVVSASPEEHDQIIAYTSQLAHVVSNAYVKSSTLKLEKGFSAGSFKDLTRVAKCNPEMWTSLFLDNKDALLHEIDVLSGHLAEYRAALSEENPALLHRLLQEGSDLKEWSNSR